MNYLWLTAYLTAKDGALREFKAEWDAYCYMLGKKMFALEGTDNTRRHIVTLKLAPADGDFLRRQYPDIIPGYYMNKEHWNSVYLDGAVPDDVLRAMIDKSYALIFAALPKSAQREITGGK